jgi:LacI family transcriptional regulator
MEIKNIESLYLRGTDGIIIAPTTTDCGYLENLLPLNFPQVFVDRQPIAYNADCVLLDNAGASYEATWYLLNKGCTRIGFVSFHFGETGVDSTIMERIEGYKKAYMDAGLAVNEDFIKTVPGGSSTPGELLHAEPYRIMKKLLTQSVQAVLCGNSLAAIGVITCLRDASIRIPQDISLITFDDDIWLSMTFPRITQSAEAMGIMAAKRLLKRIHGKKLSSQLTRLNAEIKFRQSC